MIVFIASVYGHTCENKTVSIRLLVFKGWMLEIRSLDQQNITKTVENYLPPIASKVADFETIQQYPSYFQKLARGI